MTLALGAALIIAAVLPAGAAAAKPKTVHIGGTAYEFNKVEVRLKGAVVRVVEYPKLKTVVAADDSYDLVVPAKAAKLTPYITIKGYSQVHLQTLSTVGKNLVNVNFQTPAVAIAGALGFLLGIPISSAGQPAKCVIVSTFSTKNVHNLNFNGFIGYGAHGIAGATATTSPTLPGAIYFNDQVIPDPSQKLSSKDGGVIWTGVPNGVYRISASKSGNKFARSRRPASRVGSSMRTRREACTRAPGLAASVNARTDWSRWTCCSQRIVESRSVEPRLSSFHGIILVSGELS